MIWASIINNNNKSPIKIKHKISQICKINKIPKKIKIKKKIKINKK